MSAPPSVAPREVARDAAHGLLEDRADLARRHMSERVKDDVFPFLAIDAVEKEHVQVRMRRKSDDVR